MTKKLVSFIFLIALVATSVFMANSGLTAHTGYEFKSNFVSQVNNQNSALQAEQQPSVSSKLSAVNDPLTFPYPEYNTNITNDKTNYLPGDVVSITSSLGLNGSLKWFINSPNANDEPVFDPSKSATSIFFKDPYFANTSSLVDWQNNSFKVNSFTNYLNLTYSGSGTDVLSYHQYNDIKGTFEVQFQYRRNSTDTNNLTLSYFDGQSMNSIQMNYTNTDNSLVPFDQIITLDTSNPSISSAFNFTLSSASTWLIYPISISYHYPAVTFKDDLEHQGSYQEIFVHGSSMVQRDNISVSYFVNKSSSLDNLNTFVSFNFTLPSTQVYIGQWQFKLVVTPIDTIGGSLPDQTLYSSVNVYYTLYFDKIKTYVYRGENKTNIPTFDRKYETS